MCIILRAHHNEPNTLMVQLKLSNMWPHCIFQLPEIPHIIPSLSQHKSQQAAPKRAYISILLISNTPFHVWTETIFLIDEA